jgi:uncharacterized protein with HEPN domain
MQPDSRDESYLGDMRAYALQVASFVRGASFDDFHPDSMLRSAVERSVEIIGEAANRVSRPVQEAHPEIAWGQIIGMRNVLAHGYSVVDVRVLWEIATVDVNDLILALDGMLGPRAIDSSGDSP